MIMIKHLPYKNFIWLLDVNGDCIMYIVFKVSNKLKVRYFIVELTLILFSNIII